MHKVLWFGYTRSWPVQKYVSSPWLGRYNSINTLKIISISLIEIYLCSRWRTKHVFILCAYLTPFAVIISMPNFQHVHFQKYISSTIPRDEIIKSSYGSWYIASLKKHQECYCSTDNQMKGQSEIAYLPKFANIYILLIVLVIVITE